jgi:hypothetical protein
MSALLMPPGTRKLVLDREHIAQTGDIPEGYQLFQDSMPLRIIDKRKILTESVTGKKVPVLELTGIFQRADEKNANGRVYPHKVLKEAVDSMQSGVKERRVMGEFDHPPDAKIHMDRVSHLITKLWMENKTVYGKCEVINDERSPCGSLLACYIDRGINVGISSRGVGDMEVTMFEGEDCYEVQPGFAFVTFDAVAEPSVKGTQLKRLNESLQRRLSPRQLAEAREKLMLLEVRRLLHG